MSLVAVVALAAAFAAAACGGPDEAEKARAIEAAKAAYAKARREGRDLSNGPCIADPLIENWVADVAHDPRRPVDDEPENQCAGYRAGKAEHFVELDPDGNVIRAE